MTIDLNKNGKALTVKLTGRLDTATSPDLDKIISEELDDITELTFDIHALEYTSSAGLRVFLKAQKIMNSKGSMKITGAIQSVYEIFEMTGFDEIMNIEQ